MTFRAFVRMSWVLMLIQLGYTAPLSAHHSFTATYDTERTISLQGVVTRIAWVNPHAYVFVDVVDEQTGVRNWAVEFGEILELEHAGWSADTLGIGDAIDVVGVPARGPSFRAYARSITRSGSNEPVFVVNTSPVTAVSGPAPRWPDGQVRLGVVPGETGYWSMANTVGLVEGGVDIPMNVDAILSNLSDAGRVAPFQPWARALYERRQRRLLIDDPLNRCVPPGGPRQFQAGNGFRLVEQRELGRVLVLLGGGDRNWRVIFTDGRPLAQPDEVVRTYYGTSVGHWEGDAFVVESVGFNERFWFAPGGLPHTEYLRLTERFTRSSFDTMEYQVTVDDPGAYTRPWTGGWTMNWVPNEEIQEYFCEENAESTFVR